MCDKTHSYVWQDSFICVTRLIHMRDKTHPYVCDTTYSHVRISDGHEGRGIHKCCTAFISVARHSQVLHGIHKCHATRRQGHSQVSHHAFISITPLIYGSYTTHAWQVWRGGRTPGSYAVVIRYPNRYFSPTYTVGSITAHCLLGLSSQFYSSMQVWTRDVIRINLSNKYNVSYIWLCHIYDCVIRHYMCHIYDCVSRHYMNECLISTNASYQWMNVIHHVNVWSCID